MNAHSRIAIAALCGMVLGLPAAQAVEPKSITVDLGTSEGDFAVYPQDLTLKAGEQYRLVLVNWSREFRHALMAPEFGRAIATTSIRSYPERVEIPGASFANGIDLPPGARVEMFFVPYVVGSYKLFCQDPIHTRAGMEMAVAIEQ